MSSAESAVTTVSRPRRFGRGRRTSRDAASSAARRLFFLGFKGRPGASRLHQRFRAEAPLGHLVGFALGFFVVLAPLVFVSLARFSGRAVGAFGFFAALADARLFLSDLALFRLAQPRVGERMRASAAFFFGQSAKNHAGRSSGSGRWCRWRTGRSYGSRFGGGKPALCRRGAAVGGRRRL